MPLAAPTSSDWSRGLKKVSVDLGFPFSVMLDNFIAAKKGAPTGHKSDHWDVFPEDYEHVIANTEAWPNFLRNSLSAGFNDDLHWFPGGDLGPNEGADTPWNRRKKHDFSSLLANTLAEPEQIEKLNKLLAAVASICGIDFVLENLAPETGSPPRANFEVKLSEKKPPVSCRVGLHDMSLIYYGWQVSRVAKPVLGKTPTIVEIGGGFGGFLAKMKGLFPASKCIVFDLLEVNAVQTYYLTERFPDARILGYRDFEEQGAAIFESDADFIILPGGLIREMPDETVDLVVNTRSMMEMTPEIVGYYFAHIQRLVPVGGLFSCYNRYQKMTTFKSYPYDDRWRILASQATHIQPHIHELTVERTATPQAFPITEVLKSLPPFS